MATDCFFALEFLCLQVSKYRSLTISTIEIDAAFFSVSQIRRDEISKIIFVLFLE